MHREGDTVLVVHCAEYHIDVGLREYEMLNLHQFDCDLLSSPVKVKIETD